MFILESQARYSAEVVAQQLLVVHYPKGLQRDQSLVFTAVMAQLRNEMVSMPDAAEALKFLGIDPNMEIPVYERPKPDKNE